MSDRYFIEKGVCPDCQSALMAGDAACSHCGRELPVDVVIGKPSGGLLGVLRKSDSESLQTVAIFGAGAMFFAVVLAVALTPDNEVPPEPEEPRYAGAGEVAEEVDEKATPTPPTDFVGKGEQGKLGSESREAVWVGMTSEGLDQLYRESGDAQAQLIASTRFRLLLAGTQVEVLERPWFGNLKVLILSGNAKGKVVWVRPDHVRKL